LVFQNRTDLIGLGQGTNAAGRGLHSDASQGARFALQPATLVSHEYSIDFAQGGSCGFFYSLYLLIAIRGALLALCGAAQEQYYADARIRLRFVEPRGKGIAQLCGNASVTLGLSMPPLDSPYQTPANNNESQVHQLCH
jgi:hypothetical protein